MLDIAGTGRGMPGALFATDACDYRVAGEQRLASGAGVGVAVRAAIAGNSVRGVAFQYDRSSGSVFDAHSPEDIDRQVAEATDGAWHRFAIEVAGSRYRMSLDNRVIFDGETSITCGDIYFHIWDSSHAYFRNVTFERLAAI